MCRARSTQQSEVDPRIMLRLYDCGFRRVAYHEHPPLHGGAGTKGQLMRKNKKRSCLQTHGKDDNRVKKVIGESLFNKMNTLIAGDTFTPVHFSTESSENSSGGLQ